MTSSTYNKNTALIVEGGAMRSIFSAGLLDGFLAHDFNPFDFYIGVSAGAINLLTFLTGKPEISRLIYQDFALRKEFISYRRFLGGGHLLDLDWMAKMIFKKEHIDMNEVFRKARNLYICVTNVSTGEPVYVLAKQENIEELVKASTALPVLYRDFPEVDGQAMTDGGVSDGIPITQAIRMGAQRIMVVRSRHREYTKKDTLAHRFIRSRMKQYPALLRTMQDRVRIHTDNIAILRNPPPLVNIIEICPSNDYKLGRFNRSRAKLKQGYESGYEIAASAIEQWQAIK